MNYEAIVIGVSSGGLNALKFLFSYLPENFRIPVIIVQHINRHSDSNWIKILNNLNSIHIKEADEKETIEPGKVYIAPPNYHLMIENDRTFSLTIDELVNFARPSIDVLFESAAEVYNNKLIGIVLTGSNSDGTKGLKRIKNHGGLTIAQDPATAESPQMPASAIASIQVDHILSLGGIKDLLIKIAGDID
ncbi:two-component system, chemotaxis family, response regulator CheB [Chitinophaga sp. CF118]|uniref:chemotaxis protein CheB n=1 Tax=Chitinophaga sp. CF118 TaxID=1884367 RepID=UPI0008F216CF|nr:chemotaxis protein CheB [Chitinophaga sp. CF118]SFD88286.1 two-component system, chemotaxis family, response regulator CheB [Chitinophaga sp. CF118]